VQLVATAIGLPSYFTLLIPDVRYVARTKMITFRPMVYGAAVICLPFTFYYDKNHRYSSAYYEDTFNVTPINYQLRLQYDMYELMHGIVDDGYDYNLCC